MLQSPKKAMLSSLPFSQSTQQSSSGSQALFVFPPFLRNPECLVPPILLRCLYLARFRLHSNHPTLSSPQSLHLDQLNYLQVVDPGPILFNVSSQATVWQPSQALQHSSVAQLSQSSRWWQCWGATSLTWSCYKEIAVAVKESSRPVKKRVGQQTLTKRISSTSEAWDSGNF